jgi:hypothetical protein
MKKLKFQKMRRGLHFTNENFNFLQTVKTLFIKRLKQLPFAKPLAGVHGFQILCKRFSVNTYI